MTDLQNPRYVPSVMKDFWKSKIGKVITFTYRGFLTVSCDISEFTGVVKKVSTFDSPFMILEVIGVDTNGLRYESSFKCRDVCNCKEYTSKEEVKWKLINNIM